MLTQLHPHQDQLHVLLLLRQKGQIPVQLLPLSLPTSKTQGGKRRRISNEMNHRLAPVSEEPGSNEESCTKKTWRNWVRKLFHNSSSSVLKLLLSVLGCPLSPVSLHSLLPISQVSSSAQYIIHHFSAATGCRKLDESSLKNMYATGKVVMSMVDHEPSSPSLSHKGCFVIWQMDPDKWLIELVVAGYKVLAGSDGNVAWRHTPWLGAHVAKGGVRPLRRALQGLDPVGISRVFSSAEYMGEKHVLGVECFALKVWAENGQLAERGDSSAEMIKHSSVGYFSQRSGLLLLLEDSYLARIQTPGSHPTYWETSISTKVEDYRRQEVNGMMIAHSGQSSVVITRFGDELRAGHGVTRMEETYTIDDLAFNVPGLSLHTFIPPQDIST